ncbi:MAG: hypothetical protein FJ125_18475, partial [Deltaproteobacteria bacterium]|nr:hypothetical protein [Deltaproteobacteria bacterium]
MRQLISLVLFAGFCAIAMVSLTGCFDAEHYRTLVKQGKKYDCSSDSDCIDDYKCNVQLKKCQPPLNEELKCNEIYFTAQGMTLTVHFSADNHPSVTIDRTNLEPDGTTPLGAYKVSYQASEHGVQALVEARRGLVKARIGECEFKCIAAP